MYSKPTLQRYGTFRDVTQQFVWCWVHPWMPGCSLPSSEGTQGGGDPNGGGYESEDRS